MELDWLTAARGDELSIIDIRLLSGGNELRNVMDSSKDGSGKRPEPDCAM
jgi:hypothetical protein